MVTGTEKKKPFSVVLVKMLRRTQILKEAGTSGPGPLPSNISMNCGARDMAQLLVALVCSCRVWSPVHTSARPQQQVTTVPEGPMYSSGR